MLLRPGIFEDGSASEDGFSVSPGLGLLAGLIPFRLTTFRKAVLPIFWRWRVKAASTYKSVKDGDIYVHTFNFATLQYYSQAGVAL